MVPLHRFPVQNYSEFSKYHKNYVSHKNDKVEVFGAERASVVLFEYFVSKVKFIGIFTVEI